MIRDIRLGVFLGIPCGVVFFLVFIAFFSDYLMPSFGPFQYKVLNGDLQSRLTEEDSLQLVEFLKAGVIISPRELMQDVVAFYTLIIELLVASIAGLGIVAFFSIKMISEEHLEKGLEKAINAKFDSHSFLDVIRGRLEDKFSDEISVLKKKLEEVEGILSELDDLKDAYQVVDDLKLRVEELGTGLKVIEKRIALNDDKEENIAQPTVSLTPAVKEEGKDGGP